MILSIILMVVIFSVLVIAHELGHFLAARRGGVKVEEFGIGFPPRLFKIRRGGTIYSINLFPIGGFVRLKGEDSAEKGPDSFATKSYKTKAKIVLAGVAVAALGTALQQYLLLRNSDVIKEVYSWISGRVSTATWADVRLVTPYVLAAAAVLLLHRRHLDVLRVGDEEAVTLGSEVRRVRLVVVIAATLGTAAVVSVSGLIGFVGIMVPHLVRLVVGGSYRRVLPLSIVAGAAFLILADIPGRVLEHGSETPIGVVTALVGAPMFIFVLRTRRAVA